MALLLFPPGGQVVSLKVPPGVLSGPREGPSCVIPPFEGHLGPQRLGPVRNYQWSWVGIDGEGRDRGGRPAAWLNPPPDALRFPHPSAKC